MMTIHISNLFLAYHPLPCFLLTKEFEFKFIASSFPVLENFLISIKYIDKRNFVKRNRRVIIEVKVRPNLFDQGRDHIFHSQRSQCLSAGR